MSYAFIILEVYSDKKQVVIYSKRDKEIFLCDYSVVEELLARGFSILGARKSDITGSLVLSRYSKTGTPRRNVFCGKVSRTASLADLLHTNTKVFGLCLRPGLSGTFSDGNKSVTGVYVATNMQLDLGYPFASRGNMFITKDRELVTLGSILAWSPCSFVSDIADDLIVLAKQYREFYQGISADRTLLYSRYLNSGLSFYDISSSRVMGTTCYTLRLSLPFPTNLDSEVKSRLEQNKLTAEDERVLSVTKKLIASKLGISASAGSNVLADGVVLKYDFGLCSDVDNFYIDLHFDVQEEANRQYNREALVLLFEQMLNTLGIIRLMQHVLVVKSQPGRYSNIWLISR